MGTDKVKNNKKKRIPKLPVILGVFVLLFLIALAVVFNAPFFSIKTIEVDELRHYSHDDIAAYLDSYVGTNGFKAVFKNSSLKQTRSIFSLELVEEEKRIMFDCTYLENVRVKYVPGGKLKVTAEERRESFLTEYYDTYLLCDTHGIVLETFSKENLPEGMPLVKGITPGGFKLGSGISDGKDKNIDTAIRICALMTQLEMQGYIDIADVSDYNNIYLYCAPSLTIKMGGPDDLGIKLSMLKGVMDKGVNGESNGTLTVADGKQATFVKNGEREG